MDVNQTYCGGHFAIYTNIESLCRAPETNIMLYTNSIFKKIVKAKPVETRRQETGFALPGVLSSGRQIAVTKA